MLYPIAIMVKLGTNAFALIPPFENGQCYHVSHLHSPRQLKFTSNTNSSKMGYDNTHHPYHSNCPLQCFILLIASLYFVNVHHEKWLPFTYNPASVITRNRPCSHYFRCPIFNYVICSWNHGNKYAGNCTEILIRHVWLQLCSLFVHLKDQWMNAITCITLKSCESTGTEINRYFRHSRVHQLSFYWVTLINEEETELSRVIPSSEAHGNVLYHRSRISFTIKIFSWVA